MPGGSLVAPMMTVARPSRSASHVPPSTSVVKRRSTPDCSRSNSAINGEISSKSKISSLTIHKRSSQPLAICLIRRVMRHDSCITRAASSASRQPAGVSSSR